ncbi:NADP-dependent mannitol dehydrogenase [Boletus edulis BED1]|uniref:NADP-dependent mannitol dehydrogenase n=1 Tax=Boletus edulis BED1 TaxID=1328754 RepID=A0AAD4GLV8_BOLED|nr:NADP-dependent mannitol dehydrogenase [Boletus edulis BED1]
MSLYDDPEWAPYLEHPDQLKLQGTAVVTGGNRGNGRAFSCAYAQAGMNVAIIYRTSEDAPDVAKRIQRQFQQVKVQAYQCDVRELDKLRETFKRIESDFNSRITTVIANAGVSTIKPAMQLSHDDFERIFDTNVYGVFNTCRVAAELWIGDNRQGSIITISSMSAQIINEAAPNEPLTQAFYNSSKAAVSILTKALAAEWSKKNIRVNSIAPGYVETDQTKHMDKEILRHQRKNIPLGRFAQPKELVGQALYLSSPRASYSQGSEYLIDGGKLVF